MTEFFAHCVEPLVRIQPWTAIVIHELKHQGAGPYSNGTSQLIASAHDFFNDGAGQPTVGAGRLMGRNDLENLLREILNRTARKAELLPASVVSVSHTHIAWTTPPAVRPMLFKPVGLSPQTLRVPWPRLLMVANSHGQLSVAALASRRPVAAGSKLYHAPLMNVDQQGRVCTGNAPLPGYCDGGSLPAWEAVMFESAFTHVNHPHSLKTGQPKRVVETKDAFGFWSDLARQSAERFPNRVLNPLKLSVTDFISRHA